MSTEPLPVTRKLFFREAVAKAVSEAMARDPKVLILGQDVGAFGGSYREFDGLWKAYGSDRVRDTPVAEAATVGIAAGAAAAGYRPLVSITYMDFLMLGFDPLINYAAKLKFKTQAKLSAPLVIKTTAGAQGQGVAHSQCLESWLMGVPGLKVVAPSTPADAYGLMITALKQAGPVVYIDHKRLFPIPGEVPLEETPIAFGSAAIRREGTDFTLVTHGYMTQVALRAAQALAEMGTNCEVVDLRSLSPLDMETLLRSVQKTGKLLTLEEGQTTCGVGVEVAGRIFEAMGPVPWVRLGARPMPVSSSPALESATIPNVDDVLAAVQRLLAQPRGYCALAKERLP